MGQHPDMASIVDSRVYDTLAATEPLEDDFNRHPPGENFQALRQASPRLYWIGPAGTAVSHAERPPHPAPQHIPPGRGPAYPNREQPGAYSHDTQYEQIQTFNWACIMANAVRINPAI